MPEYFWVPQAAVALIGLRQGALFLLSALNRAEVRRTAARPSAVLQEIMDGPTRAKAAEYTLEKSRFAMVGESVDTALLLVALFSGLLPALYSRISRWGEPGAAWVGASFIVITLLLLGVFSLPLDAWQQFHIEKKFGFSRMGPALWLADQAKHLAIGLLLGVPLLWAILGLVARVRFWWVWGAGILILFQLVLLFLYPRLIMPLFNRFTPLPEGELKARLLALAGRTGFQAGAIQVMDGSRRSAHSNAFFTGFGPFRHIVLYDTLVKQLSDEQLEAILAHEIGHYRRRHLPKRLALGVLLTLAGFAVLAGLVGSPWFAASFGFPPGARAPSFLLCGLLAGPVTFWLSPLGSALSRRHEYEADAFAREAAGGPAPLVGALHRLAEKNLSNLTPHPLYSAFFNSHPTVLERERALRSGAHQ